MCQLSLRSETPPTDYPSGAIQRTIQLFLRILDNGEITMKWMLLALLPLMTVPALAKEKISLDFTYKLSPLKKAASNKVVESGESMEKEIGRGDIDTVVTMTPTLETVSYTHLTLPTKA